MMVDKHVHLHVIPRYESPVKLNEVLYKDTNWPNPPILTDCISIKKEQFSLLLKQFINYEK